VASPRLVAVLGYSSWRGGGLHPICAARVETAERVAEPGDTVLFSGWSRRRGRHSEAALMREAWHGPEAALVVDGDARTTSGNARAVADAVARLGAEEVVVVTSSWHRRRAELLLRAALPPAVRLKVVTAPSTRPLRLLGRELAILPPTLAARALARRRRS
jgi:uncharacterized SAM-binding protein YcdF (DUF218 family)